MLATQPQKRIVIGAGGTREPGWIASEEEFLDLLDPGDWNRFFRPDTIDAMLAEHVWEHLDLADGLRAAQMCFKYLKPGGYLRIAVPDGMHPHPEYLEWVRVGGSGAGAYDHKVLYTHLTLRKLLEDAGFDVVLYEYFDAAGEFHDRPWSPQEGMITRSRRFDERNRGGELNYTSIVVDAVKPRSS